MSVEIQRFNSDRDEILAASMQAEEERFEFNRRAEEDREDQAVAAALQTELDQEAEGLRNRHLNLVSQKTYTGAQLGIDRNTTPRFTYTMMIVCTVMMGIELLVNNNREGEYIEDLQFNPLVGPSEETLLFMGAKRTEFIVDDKDWWRLFMPLILHAGFIHLAFNMIFLYSFGAGLEREFGHSRVIYIFFLSGFVGILFSAILNPTETTVGASGACYGLIGASWAEFFLNFSFYKRNGNWRGWLCQLTFGTVLNLMLGLIPTLDNFAHIGGFICGLLSGLQVLTLPRYDYFLKEKPDECSQIALKAFGFFITPLILIVLIIVLYVGVDVNGYCEFCSKMNCLPTPFWLCDVSCSESFSLNPLPDGSVEITCPRDVGIVIVPGPNPDFTGDPDGQFSFCELNCLGQVGT